MRLIVCLVSLVLTLAAFTSASAQDSTFTYQGQLQQGNAPFTGNANLEFRLFDQPTGGNQIGTTQTRDDWPIEDGLFQVELDFGSAAFNQQPRFLEVRVNSSPLTPRQAVRPAPVAMFALDGNEGPAGPPGDPGPPGPAGPEGPQGDAFWEDVTGGIQYDDGSIRVGTSTFDSGRVRVDAGDSLHGIRVTASTQAGNAILGQSTALSGVGVRGEATVGPTWGVAGFHSSNSGTGVFGRATNSSGETFGIHGVANSPQGTGVRGQAIASSGMTYGVFGETNSQEGFGVLGRGNSSSGTPIGVKGEVSSPGGYGMWGDSTATTGSENYGVIGTNASSSGGAGVLGRAFSGLGPASGVRGVSTSSTGWAVFSQGRFGASGTKSFMIDHPFDPTNKYLMHYSSEAPEPQNFYNGTIELDERGEAWVQLPEYFTAINRDPRYSLTPIGGAMPNLHIAEEIDMSHDRSGFRVAGGQPGLKVSWEVKAIRDDLYVRTHGAAVEVEKPESKRGTYLHPELYGQPESLGEYYIDPAPQAPDLANESLRNG